MHDVYEPNSYFFFRTPLNSLEYLNIDASKLIDIFNNEKLANTALYLASNQLWREIRKYYSADTGRQQKIEKTLYKYWVRSCSRATPYGLFAGISTGVINNLPSEIVLTGTQNFKYKTRLDMAYVFNIVEYLLKNPDIRENISYKINNSIYRVNNTYRYIEYTTQGEKRVYDLSSIPATIPINTIVSLCKKPYLYKDLLTQLSLMGVDNENESRVFLNDLIKCQLLISELEPPVTGIDPLEHIINILGPIDNIDEIKTILREVNSLLFIDCDIDVLNKIDSILNRLSISKPKNLFQTDLFITTKKSNIEKKLIEDIINQVDDILVLSEQKNHTEIFEFIKEFRSKYEDKEVPLTLLLDPDLGIQFGNSGISSNELFEGLNFPIKKNISIDVSELSRFIYTKYYEYCSTSSEKITISADEVSTLRKGINLITSPDNAHIFGSLYCNDSHIVDQKNYKFHIKSFGAPSSFSLLGRFAHANEKIESVISNFLSKTETDDSNTIYAEIVHLPQPRLGNVICRPVLRTHEIPYLSKAGTDEENQITVDDILVSIKSGKIVLKSKRLNKYIIPRMSNAHNFALDGLPIYRFLNAVQIQEVNKSAIWNWGHLEQMDFLPRVEYKNIIIHRARWIIRLQDISTLPTNNTEEFVKYFYEYRLVRNIPEKVLLVEGDNELFIDFNKVESITVLVDSLKRRKTIKVVEWLPSHLNSFIKGENGRHINELIIPITKKNKGYKTSLDLKNVGNYKKVKRNFYPNSQWIFFKIYCGNNIVEKLLRDEIYQLCKSLLKKNLFEKFFFIRYSDPDFHLRIRFYNSSPQNNVIINDSLHEKIRLLLASDTILKTEISTYSREIEKFGDNINIYESLFYFDSICSLSILNKLSKIQQKEKLRTLFILRSIDEFLNDFELSIHQKLLLVTQAKNNFFTEFGVNKKLKLELDKKYRLLQNDIFSYLNSLNDEQTSIKYIKLSLKKRSQKNKEILAKLSSKQYKNMNWSAIIHLITNRLLAKDFRKHELIIQYFLFKFYKSKIALSK